MEAKPAQKGMWCCFAAYRTLERKQLLHILPDLPAVGKLPKLVSSCPIPLVCFGVITTWNSAFEVASNCSAIMSLDAIDSVTQKEVLYFQEVRAALPLDRGTQAAHCALQALQQLWASSHELLGPNILPCSTKGLCPQLHSTRASTLCCNWNKGHVYITLGIHFYNEGQPQTAELNFSESLSIQADKMEHIFQKLDRIYEPWLSASHSVSVLYISLSSSSCWASHQASA